MQIILNMENMQTNGTILHRKQKVSGFSMFAIALIFIHRQHFRHMSAQYEEKNWKIAVLKDEYNIKSIFFQTVFTNLSDIGFCSRSKSYNEWWNKVFERIP